VRSARAHPARVALVDSGGARSTYAELLQSALELAAVVRRELPAEELRVNLPTGADAALCFVALALAGKTAVPASPYLPPAPGIDAAGLAALRARVTRQDRDEAARIGRMGGRKAARLVDPEPAGARPAVVIHSSGSSGAPKAVLLSHANIAANVQSVSQVFRLSSEDRVLGVLPFFHALGYSATIWLPLLSGARVVFHSNPLDAPGVEALCLAQRPTILLASPTFCRVYERRVAKPAFASLRLSVCGSEKLPPELARAWKEKFGTELFEGYGATELAPVAAVNVPDFQSGSARQENHRPGSVGRALPGVALRVVDAHSGALQPPGTQGLLLVRGPNVTPGYRNDPGRTAEALRDGWYSTGDIAQLDKDGFLSITDRLSRFSKLGGEMVPHGRVEEALRAAHRARAGEAPAGAPELELAVVGVPDDRKGERLVVLHAHARLEPQAWLEELAHFDLPALFRPREPDFIALPSLPRLPTGKLDLAAARARAIAGA
jgi:acyl-[acyl-carrier-protein]-phospholipid O-acyltransferase/long-chain-fatty-acid--[acyl-carrier-protein] ligase